MPTSTTTVVQVDLSDVPDDVEGVEAGVSRVVHELVTAAARVLGAREDVVAQRLLRYLERQVVEGTRIAPKLLPQTSELLAQVVALIDAMRGAMAEQEHEEPTDD